MPLYTLTTIAGTHAYTEWVAVGGAATYEACLATDDADTTYITDNAEDHIAACTVSELPAEVAAITSVKIVARAKTAAAPVDGGMNLFVTRAAAFVHAADVTLTAAYATYEAVAIGNVGGGAWEPANWRLNNTQPGVRHRGDPGAGDDERVTYLAVVVDGVLGGRGFAFLIGSLLGPVVGAGLTLRDAVGLANAVRLASSGLVVIQRREVVDLLEDLRRPTRTYLALAP